MVASQWETLLNDLKLQCKTNDTTKYISTVVFCEKEATLKLFFQYIDSIDTHSKPKLGGLPTALSPIGYYTKEITTEEGWQIVLNITTMPPPWKTSSINLLPSVLKSDPFSKSLHFVLLLDWMDENQSYWLKDINELFTHLNLMFPDDVTTGSVMMLHSDYCKHLENTHTRWSSSAVDLMHQCLRTLALNLQISLQSDFKNSKLAAKSAVGMLLTAEENKELADLVNLDNLNVSVGSDTLNKIAMIDENFPLSKYNSNLPKLLQYYSEAIPVIQRRLKKTSTTTESIETLSDPQSLLLDVQQQLAHLYNLQRKNLSVKRANNQSEAIQEVWDSNETPTNEPPNVTTASQSVSDDDSALDSLVDGIVQRHHIS
ncbi:unnamed protein product [Kluyveromyces dobzhanskii CBS 2104]|uniref:WGS project CCBQ000000000 data, contig 00107 n=1 Tax=Kluyveromyces dobzhanskii CBS 2104 TaxID=1427455 RepID=A0A0A8L126_9SACH|nr:unnamed protein product [Kluyveromyces dobzhanskii CBS 2104]